MATLKRMQHKICTCKMIEETTVSGVLWTQWLKLAIEETTDLTKMQHDTCINVG